MKIEELCLKLHQKRQERGLSLEEVVEKTKLYPSVIKDIEAGNLGNIAPAYLRGYIKIYANFLGVEIGDALQNLAPVKANKVKSAPESPLSESNKEKKEISAKKIKFPIPPQLKKIVLLVVISLISLLILVHFVKFISHALLRKPARTSRNVERKIQRPTAVQPKSQTITVSLTAKKDTFIRVKVDGRILFEGVLKKGLSDTWKGRKEIEFRISDGSTVYLEVNGKALPALTAVHKQIKSLKVTPAGVSVIK
jgi:cytoskeletal protein RodZ